MSKSSKSIGVWYMRYDPQSAEFCVVEPDGTTHVVNESAVFQDPALNRLIAAMARALTQPGFLFVQERLMQDFEHEYLAAYKKIASMGQMPEPVPQPPAVDGATLAGLIASEGHLSTLVDQMRALLIEVEDHFSRGWLGSLEDGESEIIDKVRAMIAMTNGAPQPPAVSHGITNHQTGCGACGDGCKSRGSCRLADESPEQQAKAAEGGAA